MIKAVAAKGGGTRGYAYAGVLSVLEPAGIISGLEKTVGTSAGSLIALLIALRYTAAQIRSIVGSLNFGSLQSGFSIFRELIDEGLYSNKHLIAFIDSIVSPKLGHNATFADMRKAGYLDYRCVASIPAIQDIQVFGADMTPDTDIVLATCTSASIPGFFPKMRLPGFPYDMVDGGLIENFYITAFDKELKPEETLGLFLYNSAPVKPLPTSTLPQMTIACFESALAAQDVIDMNDPETMNRSIIIDTLGISSTDFGVTPDQTAALYQSGIDCATKYFSKFDAK